MTPPSNSSSENTDALRAAVQTLLDHTTDEKTRQMLITAFPGLHNDDPDRKIKVFIERQFARQFAVLSQRIDEVVNAAVEKMKQPTRGDHLRHTNIHSPQPTTVMQPPMPDDEQSVERPPRRDLVSKVCALIIIVAIALIAASNVGIVNLG